MTKWLALALVLAACGHNDSATQPDAPPPPPDAPPPFMEATHGMVPQLVNDGGTVLLTPKIQPIFFTNDAVFQTDIEQFTTQLTTSSYWTATTAEYGVGAVSVLPTIVTTDAVPTTQDGIETWLAGNLDGTHTAAGWPAAVDPQTIYSVFLPDGAVITGADGNSCDAYGGYHYEIASMPGQSIVYAVMPRCQGGIDNLTAVLSHELVEAATDPRPVTAVAWGDSDHPNYVMAYTPGAEAGDYCEYVDSAFIQPFGGWVVQRIWSNAASLAGTDPCVPRPTTPYVAAVPMFAGTVDTLTDYNNNPVTTLGISVPVGMTSTVNVQLISDVPTTGFTLEAIDAAQLSGGSPELTLAFDTPGGINGDVVHLSITRAKAGQLPGSEFLIAAKLGGQIVSEWWGYVAN
jgi:hypothetical protein